MEPGQFGDGLMVRGKHWIVVDKPKTLKAVSICIVILTCLSLEAINLSQVVIIL